MSHGEVNVVSAIDVSDAVADVGPLQEACHDMRQPAASVLALAAAALAEPELPAAARACPAAACLAECA
jgi:hypothetical protein